MTFLIALWQWIQQNPLLVWPIVSALVSWLYTKTESIPRLHAFFSLLAGFGIDLPKILTALQKLITGAPANPQLGSFKHPHEELKPVFVSGNVDEVDAKMQPPGSNQGKQGFARVEILVGASFVVASGMLIGFMCSQPGCAQAIPAVVPAIPAVACILEDIFAGSVAKIAADCGTDIETVIATLLKSSDPKVQASPAYGEALRMNAAKDAGGQ